MNTTILNQYNIKFVIVKNDLGENEPKAERTDLTNILSFVIKDLIFYEYPDIDLFNHHIEQINKAQSNAPYDPSDDGGPLWVSVEFGWPNCTLTHIDGAKAPQTISSNDLREILLSWVEFLEENGFDEV
jgi:hypothetical protein